MKRGDELLLFDVGEGTQRQMIQTGLGFNRKMKVFITHLHGDHVVGLLGLLQTMSMLQREKTLPIYGPAGVKGFLQQSIKYLRFGLTYSIEVHSVKEGIIAREKEYLIRACPAQHSMRSYAYLLEEYDRPGIFYPEKAIALGVPKGELWSRLQHGESVAVGGKVAKPSQVLGPKRPGRKIGISGDTRPTQRLTRFFTDAEVLIFDSTYGQDLAEKAAMNMHSTCSEAAELAKKANVKLLILTHFSARYADVGELVQEASKIHPNVMAASDLLVVDVPYRDSE